MPPFQQGACLFASAGTQDVRPLRISTHTLRLGNGSIAATNQFWKFFGYYPVIKGAAGVGQVICWLIKRSKQNPLQLSPPRPRLPAAASVQAAKPQPSFPSRLPTPTVDQLFWLSDHSTRTQTLAAVPFFQIPLRALCNRSRMAARHFRKHVSSACTGPCLRLSMLSPARVPIRTRRRGPRPLLTPAPHSNLRPQKLRPLIHLRINNSNVSGPAAWEYP